MTIGELCQRMRVLVAIDISKARNDVLIETPRLVAGADWSCSTQRRARPLHRAA